MPWACFLPDPENCNKYYMCQKDFASTDGWKAIHMSCLPGLQFDTIKNVCNYAQQANCMDKALGSSSVNQIFPENPDSLCRQECEGSNWVNCFIPDQFKCSSYWMCYRNCHTDEWEAIHKNCNLGLQFDPILNTCNYQEMVGCVDKPN